jgi:hypothetical protein
MTHCILPQLPAPVRVCHVSVKTSAQYIAGCVCKSRDVLPCKQTSFVSVGDCTSECNPTYHEEVLSRAVFIVVLWPVWPPRTIKCSSDNDNTNDDDNNDNNNDDNNINGNNVNCCAGTRALLL